MPIFFPPDILRIEIVIDTTKTRRCAWKIFFMQTSTDVTEVKIKIKKTNTLWSVSFQFINKKQL